jgi:hypothetical protein
MDMNKMDGNPAYIIICCAIDNLSKG